MHMANDCWGWTDRVEEYAIIGLDNGTAFIDITVPNLPVIIGKLPTQTEDSVWRDIKFWELCLHRLRSRQSWYASFDLAHLRDTTTYTIFSADSHYDGFGNAHNIAINEDSGYAYVLGTQTYNGGAHFVDISNPENPTSAGGYAEKGYSHDAMIVTYNGPDLDYKGKEIYFGSNVDEVTLSTLINQPHLVSSYSQSGTHQGWLEDHRYFVGMSWWGTKWHNARTIILDFSDLDEPINHVNIISNAVVITTAMLLAIFICTLWTWKHWL